MAVDLFHWLYVELSQDKQPDPVNIIRSRHTVSYVLVTNN